MLTLSNYRQWPRLKHNQRCWKPPWLNVWKTVCATFILRWQTCWYYYKHLIAVSPVRSSWLGDSSGIKARWETWAAAQAIVKFNYLQNYYCSARQSFGILNTYRSCVYMKTRRDIWYVILDHQDCSQSIQGRERGNLEGHLLYQRGAKSCASHICS